MNQRDGMVSFHDNPEKYNSVGMLAKLDEEVTRYMARCSELITLSAPLSMHVSTLFLITTLLHVLYTPTTPICCQFLKSAQHLLCQTFTTLSVAAPSGTYTLLAFTLVHRHNLTSSS